MQTKSNVNVLGALFLASLLFLSGCTLFWLGLGGTGGYMIRKGEEGGTSKTERSSGGEKESATRQY